MSKVLGPSKNQYVAVGLNGEEQRCQFSGFANVRITQKNLIGSSLLDIFVFILSVYLTNWCFYQVPIPDLKQYLLSILVMPQSLKLVCATNLFCWMAHVCYSLYFTDYVGESVFKGDPAVNIISYIAILRKNAV